MNISSRPASGLLCDHIADSNAIISIVEDIGADPSTIEIKYIEGNVRKTLVLTHHAVVDPVILLSKVLIELGFATSYEEIR